MAADDDEWWTRQQVADHFQVGLRTVGRWLENGLPHAKFGDAPNAAVRIRRADAEQWWRRHYTGGAA